MASKLNIFKYQLYSSCEMSKAKKKFIQSKGCSKFQKKAKFASHGLMWSNAGCKHKWAKYNSGDVDEYSSTFGTSFSTIQALKNQKFSNDFSDDSKHSSSSSNFCRTDRGKSS
ncbi:hypothetical protein Tco_0272872 [Tanacetum coccineum]